MFDENATQLGPAVFVEEVEEVCPMARFEVMVSVALLGVYEKMDNQRT